MPTSKCFRRTQQRMSGELRNKRRARAAGKEAHEYHNDRMRRRAAVAGMGFKCFTASLRRWNQRWAIDEVRINRKKQ